MPTCCMVTRTGNDCTRTVQEEGLICHQHAVMLARQAVADRPPSYDDAVFGGDTGKKATVKERQAEERERLGMLAACALVKGIETDKSARTADGSARWIWTVPIMRTGKNGKGYFGQFDTDGDLLVRCDCRGCAPVVRSKAKMLQRPIVTVDHCVLCTCKDCVCPARAMCGACSDRALTGWWDNPCGGKCGGCKRLATECSAGAARGWTA